MLRSLICVYCSVTKSKRWCCWMFALRPSLSKTAVIFLLLCVVPTPSSQGGMSYSGVISSSQKYRLNSSPLHPPLSEGQTGCIMFPLLFISEQNTFYTAKQMSVTFWLFTLFSELTNKGRKQKYAYYNIHNHGKIQVYIYFSRGTILQHFSNML